ncbi:MAG: NAD-dependent epimerase/dehydratase family protein [Halobacteriaceae archaeon]
METVIVTGGLGRAGRWVLDALADDYDVVCLDFDHPGSDDRVEFIAADLADGGETRDAIGAAAPDAVVHLAAYPNTRHHAGSTVFENNVESAYNVLDAAGRAGADAVWTSSTAAYDRLYHPEAWPPDRLPVEESYPQASASPYATSKIAGEAVAEMVHRRHGVPVVSLRPTLVVFPGDERMAENRAAFPPEAPTGNFLSYVDARDLAALVAAALDADLAGHDHEAYNVTADDQYLGRETTDALDAVYGELPADCELSGEDALFSNRKAREAFGWAPEYTWRETEADDTPAPSFGDE